MSSAQACHECHAQSVVLYYVGRRHFAKRCGSCGHSWKEPREAEVVDGKGYVTDYPENYERGTP
jgi:hypothetical protein